ncbi:PucR C-terminal helix-turn-helix domain-containing protein [Dethiosulfatibacter aminovorans DSM 17477]|uniref:PucR C-terminal helix-turn-helix domain-containing protein n=1 Tax=Dethiosulfatibacter aminovorans DSM 17477 TaxID=1121476 RepID=A0A1M6BMJ8_9FIRM|nr:PucR family transcriptional regulator [Dethiosulfatibacter aminovorans]SHI49896.1 PucR C-terminal helix-turn-helix domain-containing protein [Dethiosulfatibacter aminovorans DSM 17477]
MKIDELFALNKDFRKFEYICGVDGKDNEINNIEVTEVPEGVYWVKEGDLLVTTGYFFRNDEVAFENFIKMLIYHKAAGLAIKLGRYIDKIPQKIVQIAENNNFPIINVPFHMRYSSILWPVANKLVDTEKYSDYILKTYKKELKEEMKNNYNLDAITDLLSVYIGSTVSVFWENNKKQINTSDVLETRNIHRTLMDNYKTLFQTDKRYGHIEKEEGQYFFFKIEAVNQIVAYMGVFYPKTESISETDLELVEETIPFISIYLLSNSHHNLSHYKSLNEFYQCLIEGDYSNNERKLREEAAYFDMEFNKSRYVWIVQMPEISVDNYRRFVNIATSHLDLSTKEYYLIEKSKRLIFITSTNAEQFNERYIIEFYSELIKRIEYSFKGLSYFIGISKVCNVLKYLNYAHDEAVFAYKLGSKIHPERKIYYYDDYIVYHLLHEVSDHPALSKIYKNTVERIIRYDAENNTDFFDTLSSLIENDFNINQTANALFVHRNTLYKRMNKIDNLLDLNLEKSESRLLLQLAFKLKDLQN